MTGESDGRVSIVAPELDEKPWGGRKLERFGLDLPNCARIGEALVSSNSATIATGMASGRTLGDVVTNDPERMLGMVGREVVRDRVSFPLLVKLIDASENLSIQVHPNDEQAAAHDHLGKTEAWHILAADPGSIFYAGLEPGVSSEAFLQACESLDGSSARLLRRIPAQPGTTILLPAGTVHALGAGVMVYEIQQPSNVTYRLDDWGRVDTDGDPREMHLEAGAAIMQPGLRPELIPPVTLPMNEGRRQVLAMCRKFALERIALVGGGRCTLSAVGSPQVITVLAGELHVDEEPLRAGRSAVIWPGHIPAVQATGPSTLLRGWVPDLEHELASLLTGPAVDREVLSVLAGPLPDIRQALEALM